MRHYKPGGKDRFRQKDSCSFKEPFQTFLEARRAIQKMHEKRRIRVILKPYRCQCGKIHIGTWRRKDKQKRTKKNHILEYDSFSFYGQ